jgi:hypothetical protein
MAQAVPQTHQNHGRYVIGFHVVTFFFVLANFVWSIVQLFRQRFGVASIFGMVVAVVLAQLFFYTRQFATGNQDRIIRLEMRLRLERLLPADLKGRLGEFTVGQLVALRFAGDAELPTLARKVLDEKIADRKQIKLMIKDWQADYLRI